MGWFCVICGGSLSDRDDKTAWWQGYAHSDCLIRWQTEDADEYLE